MATKSVTNPTLADLQKALDPDGRIATTIELLNEDNPILDDITFAEGNLPTGHRTTVRTGITEPTYRKLYGGVQPTKSTRAQITDNCAMLEDYIEIDPALIALAGDGADSFKMDEGRAHIEGFGQTVANGIFYANEAVAPEQFTGLAPRFSDLSAENAENIIDAGGTGVDNASIWLVGWSPQTCQMIYPKGSNAGLGVTPKGVSTVQMFDASGNPDGLAEMDRTHMKWDLGLNLKDWRAVGRICNIDKSLLANDKATGADLIDLMVQLDEAVKEFGGARYAWYVPKTVRTMLRRQILKDTANSTLSWDNIAGRKVLTFAEKPLRVCAALAGDEARVV